jgi:tetratricopeptide (TPR) repeat protein
MCGLDGAPSGVRVGETTCGGRSPHPCASAAVFTGPARARRQGRPEAARGAYERALAAEPACATLLCNLAAALAQLGRHAEAAAAARASLAVTAAYGKARRRLADSLRACGRCAPRRLPAVLWRTAPRFKRVALTIY